MLSLGLLFTSVLLGFAAAQNTTFNPALVDLTTKNQWCQGEQNNCPLLCGGFKSTKDNKCDGSSLTYTCTCSNGTGPANIDQYQGTLPNHICQATFQQCREANPGATCQSCGTLQPTDVKAAATSTAAATSSTGSMTSTAPASTATAKKGAAAGRVEGVTGVVAVVVVGAAALVL